MSNYTMLYHDFYRIILINNTSLKISNKSKIEETNWNNISVFYKVRMSLTKEKFKK